MKRMAKKINSKLTINEIMELYQEYADKQGLYRDLEHDELLHIRASADTSDLTAKGDTLTGYMVHWDVMNSHWERVRQGAFEEFIEDYEESPQRMLLLWNHDTSSPASVIGYITEFEEDDIGLRFTAELRKTSAYYREVKQLLSDGEMQVSYRRVPDHDGGYDYVKDKEGGDYIEITNEGIREVSIVPMGSNQWTAAVLDERQQSKKQKNMAKRQRRSSSPKGEQSLSQMIRYLQEQRLVGDDAERYLSTAACDVDEIDGIVDAVREVGEWEERVVVFDDGSIVTARYTIDDDGLRADFDALVSAYTGDGGGGDDDERSSAGGDDIDFDKL